MKELAKILNDSTEYNKILASIKNNSVVVNGLSMVQKRHMVFSIAEKLKRPFIFVVQNDAEIKNTILDLETFTGKEVLFLPSETMRIRGAKSKDIVIDKVKIFEKILKGEMPNLVVNSDILFDKFENLTEYRAKIVEFKTGETVDLTLLEKLFVDLGYERCELVEGVGQFAIRGGILDFYSPSVDYATRIEFFDDEIDSIRNFDVFSQRTIEQVDAASLYPIVSETKSDVSIFEWLNDNYLVFVEEPQRIIDKIDLKLLELNERVDKEEIEDVTVPSKEEILCILMDRKTIFLSAMDTRLKDFSKAEKFFILSRELTGFGNLLDNFKKALKEWQDNENRIIILAGTESKAKNLAKELEESGLTTIYMDELLKLPNPGSIYIVKGSLSAGFEYADVKTILLSDREIFGVDKIKKARANNNKGIPVNIDELKTGEYIVHNKHGIGIYLGIDTLEVDGVVKDYIKIQYAKEDTLYVPINQLDSVSKYIGADGRVPRINKMGGQDWDKVKAKVKVGLQDIAEKLVKIYAKREMSEGFAFPEDTVWQQEFEDEFAYEETDDQLRCIEEIKKDMEKKRPMDRLLCGDVGYGKTEVAIRAAFKAIMGGKQVAYLAPTTVLVSQHYQNFLKRMKSYPVKIQVLSRLRTKKEQEQILKQLKAGEIDVIIGTHRLVQKDVIFKDLGLLIIDEEQKFGVMDKERIKEMKENVDVLTLSATPIPRTLHMSMVGVKDVSVIYAPPSNRNPVQTYVFEYDRGIIREAITRELERDGQVYYLYNRVEDIEKIAAKIQEDIPWARVVFAHGKLAPKELEDIMLKFSEHEYDILVCTTIIDSGLDIPNANTIIVENAENLGLSQLYQLRGRVGRSDKLAYAYITYRKDKILSEIAEKRLKAIKEFTEFGSGIKIAMRDLEIRGAGSLIGAEQHGHMDSVGYETYCEILSETIAQMQGIEKPAAKEETQVDLNINAYISDKYIKNEVQKMEMYQKISRVANEEALMDIIDELTDRFGDIPKETEQLLKIVEIKYLAMDLGIINIAEKNGNIVLEFMSNAKIDIEKIGKIVAESKRTVMFSAGAKPYLTLIKEKKEKDNLKNIKFVLQSLKA
ncbi:MAG: transcription-repair coupling factor [Clostridiales bacterium]|nr:transcription-repair coupling factor [Clostridiales bacterium]